MRLGPRLGVCQALKVRLELQLDLILRLRLGLGVMIALRLRFGLRLGSGLSLGLGLELWQYNKYAVSGALDCHEHANKRHGSPMTVRLNDRDNTWQPHMARP